MEFMAVGNGSNGAAWRRQSAMGPPRAGGGGLGFGYPRWGVATARANGGARGAGGGEVVNEEGGVEGGVAAVALAGAGAGAGARWSIDVGAEGGEASKDEQREEPTPDAAAEGSPAKAKATSPDGRSPVRDLAEASLAGASSPVVLPEALPE